MRAVRISGPAKSVSSSSLTRTTMGARRITAVALGRMAQTTAVSTMRKSRKRRPLPRVRMRKRVPRLSKMPVGARTRATTMPPKSSDNEPAEALMALNTSPWVSWPSRVSAHSPSMAMSVMSARFKAMHTMTRPNTTAMAKDWVSIMMGSPEGSAREEG